VPSASLSRFEDALAPTFAPPASQPAASGGEAITWSEELLFEYAEKRGGALRETIIRQYRPLVRYVARRMTVSLPSILDAEDITAYGTIGLIDAVERFDPRRGVKFQTYALSRIRGSIIDNLRALDPVSRPARRRRQEIEQARARLEGKLGRPPTDEEVARDLGVELSKLREVLARNSAVQVSIDAPVESDGSSTITQGDLIPDADTPDPSVLAEKRDSLRRMIGAMRILPERERRVVLLYYREEVTMAEIARGMGISESRVRQLHERALARLRDHLAPDQRAKRSAGERPTVQKAA
jgi:RNA polymerase sigma factor FliA